MTFDLTDANPWLVVLAMLVFWLAMVVNATKWQVLLRARIIVVLFGAILNYTFVGFFFNNFLPASVGGDVMRGYGLACYTDRNADAAASVVLDRLIGLAAYMSVAAVAALLRSMSPVTTSCASWPGQPSPVWASWRSSPEYC